MKVPRKSKACKTCSKTFSAQKDLNKHLVWHNLQLKHVQSSYVKVDRIEILKCMHCTRGFLDQYTYDQHKEEHLQRNIVPTSNDNENLEKPHKCEECGWRFVQKSTLDAHSFVHKPFENVCECGIGFYKKCDLDAHRRLVHPNANSTANKVNRPYKITKSEKVDESDTAQSESENEHETDKNNFRTHSNPALIPKLKGTHILKEANKKNHIKKNGFFKEEDDTNDIEANSKKSILHTYLTAHKEVQQKRNKHPKKCLKKNQLHHKRSSKKDISFTCNVCNKNFKAKKNLEMHMRTHTGEKPYTCHICKKSFSQSGALKIHTLRHTGVKDFKCNECEKEFYTLSALSLHQRTHTGEKPFECKVCGKRFADPSAHKRHALLHTGLKPFQCKHCQMAFADWSALTVHVRRHAGWTIRCPTCNKSFKNRTGLLNHIKIEHTILKDENKFECDHCHKDFILKQYLVGHIQRVHMKMSSFSCNICGKKFQTKPYLKTHIKCVHERNFKFKCHICKKLYFSKSALENHKVVHDESRSRNYECDDCLAIFFDKWTLLSHITSKHLRINCKDCKKGFSTTRDLKRHESEGCQRCSVCRKAYATISHLNDHYITHHARKNEVEMHECDECFKQFNSKTALTRHINYCHSKKELSFTCDHCNETYTKKTILVKHIIDKHMVSLYCNVCLKRFLSEVEFKQHKAVGCMIKQISCGICEKVFKRNTFKSHLATHLPKKFECDMCGKRFTHRGGLILHLKVIHKTKRTKKKLAFN